MDWISIEDRLPEDDQTVFCWHDNQSSSIPLICYYEADGQVFITIFCEQEVCALVDYWMPLPEAPEKIN